jgi:hypothetical protein
MNKQLAILASITFLTFGTQAMAEDTVLKKCQGIKLQLAKLESLREYGGSAKKMDNWKRQIHDKQDEYSKLYCRQYRFELDKH